MVPVLLSLHWQALQVPSSLCSLRAPVRNLRVANLQDAGSHLFASVNMGKRFFRVGLG